MNTVNTSSKMSEAGRKAWATRRANAAAKVRAISTVANSSKMSEAGRKAWETRRANLKTAVTALDSSRSAAANKAWATRRTNTIPAVTTSSLVAQLRPRPTITDADVRTNNSFTKGLRKREVTAKTVVERIKTASRVEYYTGTDRNVIVMYKN